MNNDGWILCRDRLPQEHDSIFAKYYGTEKWNHAMFRKCSDEVLVTRKYEEGMPNTAAGKLVTNTDRLVDGEWKERYGQDRYEIVAWMPFPSPCQEVQEGEQYEENNDSSLRPDAAGR